MLQSTSDRNLNTINNDISYKQYVFKLDSFNYIDKFTFTGYMMTYELLPSTICIPENYSLLPLMVHHKLTHMELARIYNEPFNSTHPWFDQFASIRSSHVWFPLRDTNNTLPVRIHHNNEHYVSRTENQCSNSYAIKISIIQIIIPYGGCNRQRNITNICFYAHCLDMRGSHIQEK